jgi:hypothetical protein
MAVLVSGCSHNASLPEGVVTIPDAPPQAGYEYALPGPLRTARPFNTAGPFKSHFEALRYACPILMSLPGAIAKRRATVVQHGAFIEERSWDDSTEYCAWIYQTPDGAYELSWIGTNEAQDRSEYRKCDMPPRVLDARYNDDPALAPDRNLTYVFAVHSHPVASLLTRYDIAYIIKLGRSLKESFHSMGQFSLGIIAFFSRNEHDKPTCDGFFQYTLPLDELQSSTKKIQKWTTDATGAWKMEEVAMAHHEYPPDNKDPYIKIIDLQQR